MLAGKIKQLTKLSRQVIADCCLENGAIIAANTDKEYYPKNVADYRFVWPRDVAFTLYAAHLLGIKDIQEPFLDWLLKRAEGFAASGILYQRYVTNGARDVAFGSQYQPDQAGALLWSLLETNQELSTTLKKVITLLADGLCANWSGKHFIKTTYDLWEERRTLPSLADNFSYSLAACSFGLQKAAQKLNNKKWLRVSAEMLNVLKNSAGPHYLRVIGDLSDQCLDASMLGLIWPFSLLSIDTKIQNGLRQIEKKLLTAQGMLRYENDEYDGTVENAEHWRKGGGGWPLLTFWYMVVLAKMGARQKASQAFLGYIKKIPTDYLPEQIFTNSRQASITPLCWSHAMFVIAAKELGYLVVPEEA